MELENLIKNIYETKIKYYKLLLVVSKRNKKNRQRPVYFLQQGK